MESSREDQEESERRRKRTWHLGSSVDELGLDVIEEGSLDCYTRLCRHRVNPADKERKLISEAEEDERKVDRR